MLRPEDVLAAGFRINGLPALIIIILILALIAAGIFTLVRAVARRAKK